MLGRTIAITMAAALIGAARGAPAPAQASTPEPSVTPAMLNAAHVYDRALAFVRAQRYPSYLSFVVTVRTSIKDRPNDRWLVEQFASLCRTRDDRVVTNAKPLSTTNQGDNPYGFNVKLRGLAVRNSKDIEEPFGLPQISPVFSFGLVRLHPSISALREYDVALLGVETLGRRSAYHLTLTPRADPALRRLRDLWVDAQTFAILRLTSAGAFTTGPATSVKWDVTYTIDQGHWLIESESTNAAMLLGGYAPALNTYVALPGATKYYGVSYSFSNFTYPAQVSDLIFFEVKRSQAVQM